jgi:hypothetical protein
MWSRTLLEANRLKEALAVLDSARLRYGDQEELIRQELLAFEAGISHLVEQGATDAAKTQRSTVLARHPQATLLHDKSAGNLIVEQSQR